MKLSIRNFGPIKKADIETNKYNFFIGNTSTGKSVAAKLIAIANSNSFFALNTGDLDEFKRILAGYSINFEFKRNSKINITIGDEMECTISADGFEIEYVENSAAEIRHSLLQISDIKSYIDFCNKIKLDKGTKKHIKNLKHFMNEMPQDFFEEYVGKTMQQLLPDYSVYIPAERNLFSLFTNSIYSILYAGSVIPESILRFGRLYEKAKNKNPKFLIDFLKLNVEFSKGNDLIDLGNGKGKITFMQASSGMQSIIPLWTVFADSVGGDKEIIIEEPESNLFPTVQIELLKKIVELTNDSLSSVYITTHSPYIFSAVDNLIYANDVYEAAKDKGDSKLMGKIAKLVSPSSMVKYEDVSSYYFDDNGNVQKVNNDKHRLTGADAIDKASDNTSVIFDQLMDLENEL